MKRKRYTMWRVSGGKYVEAVLDRALKTLNYNTRLTAFEVELAAGLKPELTVGLQRRQRQ